ncbi:MAG: hypothetical protein QW270_02685 [Candidatus Bathyarchaeia archaeon]
MKAESAVLAGFTTCIFFTFYFAFLSFQLTDDILKKQSVNFAVYFLLTGIILLALFTVYSIIKTALLKHIET